MVGLNDGPGTRGKARSDALSDLSLSGPEATWFCGRRRRGSPQDAGSLAHDERRVRRGETHSPGNAQAQGERCRFDRERPGEARSTDDRSDHLLGAYHEASSAANQRFFQNISPAHHRGVESGGSARGRRSCRKRGGYRRVDGSDSRHDTASFPACCGDARPLYSDARSAGVERHVDSARRVDPHIAPHNESGADHGRCRSGAGCTASRDGRIDRDRGGRGHSGSLRGDGRHEHGGRGA